MTNLKNLEVAIKNQPKINNFFDSNYTVDILFKNENSAAMADSDTMEDDNSLVGSLQGLASSISSLILNFPHVSKLMDADGKEQQSFFDTFTYLKDDQDREEDNLREAFRKVFTKEYGKINKDFLKDPNFMNSIKDLQIAIVRKHGKVIDLKTLFSEVKNSQVLMEYFGSVTTRSEF
jgi:hypothetical protein